MDHELEVLRTRRQAGRVPSKRNTMQKTEALLTFFSSRQVLQVRLAEVIGVTKQIISHWRKLGIPEGRLPAVRALRDKILVWELHNNKIFPG